ncbi:MAG: B12-binding domain-containing radical SAM protein [bacterium]|nr:B12-binding domain-containing radical SAM protein [bacterium]
MEKFLYTPNTINRNYKLTMAYPSKEEFALSSLGYMWLSKIADTTEGIDLKRISTDTPNLPFKNTDAIAFSMSFDFDYYGVFEILEKNNIPFFSSERDENQPLIFAGGHVITTNPRPYDKIFDFMMIGDGEDSFKEILELFKLGYDKKTLLEKLSEIEGIYVPNKTLKVKKCTAKLNSVIYTPVLNEKSYFKNTFIVELQRGCMNRCAFCTASYLNFPFRSYSYKNIISAIDDGLKYTDKIALLGAQITSHPDFNQIMDYIKTKMLAGEQIKLGISSLRTDSITAEIIKTLVLGGQKTSTIAIEAASEHLRKFINKNLTDKQIFNAVKICSENGLTGLKIYSMIGIPTETQDDIESFLTLAKKLKLEFKGFDLSFSFSSFVPKPNTPFERMPREETKSLEKKQKYLEKEFAKLGIESKFSSIKWDYWQTVLSRGDSSFGEFLVKTYLKGKGLSSFKSAIKEVGIDISKAVNGRSYDEKQPWDFIDIGISKTQLATELKRLKNISNRMI